MKSSVQVKNLPPKEAISYWQDRVPVTEEEFDALVQEARSKAFFVRGLSDDSMQEFVAEKMGKALEEGTTFADFKKDVRETFEKSGFDVRRNWRLQGIFLTNVLQAYSVGRYKQMTSPAVLERRPFWQYDAIDDGRTRPAHRALDGKVFRADDPIWDSIYTPNGFRCRCIVRTLSGRDMERKGLEAENGDDVLGSTVEMDGLAIPILPDRGWDHNPGKTHWGDPIARAEVLSGERSQEKAKVLGDEGLNLKPLPKNQDDYARHDDMTPEKAREAWARALGGESTVHLDKLGKPVLFAGSIRDHAIEQDLQRMAHVEALLPTLQDPDEVWLQPTQFDDGRVVLRRLYIRRFASRPMTVVSEAQRGVWTGYTMYPTRTPKTRRKGQRLYARK